MAIKKFSFTIFSTLLLSAGLCFGQDSDFTPVEVRPARVGYSKITLSWQPGSSSTRELYYKVLRDGSEIGTSTALQYTDDSLRSGAEYGYKVIAVSPTGQNSPVSTELEVKTMESAVWDNSGDIEQVVDQLHDTAAVSGAEDLIAAVKNSLEALLDINITFTGIDLDILKDSVAEELALIKKAVTEDMSDTEYQTAQTELEDILREDFGGNSFGDVYIYGKLTDLAEEHWRQGRKDAAKALYNFSLNYLSNQENFVFDVLHRLAQFELAEITFESSNAKIVEALNAQYTQYCRFFDFFTCSTSKQALYARRIPAWEYFKYFPYLLTYSSYDRNVFANARQVALAALSINENDTRVQKLFEKIDAWELVYQQLTFRDSNGDPVPATMTVKNITANSDKKDYFYKSDEYDFIDERQYTVSNGEEIVPEYKGHIYEISFAFDVAGGNPLEFCMTGMPVEQGKVVTFNNSLDSVQTDGDSNTAKLVFIVDHPTAPYNVAAAPFIDVFDLSWDWADSADFAATHFKVFRGMTEIADVSSHEATYIPLESPDGIFTYTVAAYDASGNVSPSSRELIVVPGDQTPYADYFKWMQRYFGNQEMYSCNDPDGDGVSNYQEFLNGTDPTRIPGPAVYLRQKTYSRLTLQWDKFLKGESGVSFKVFRDGVEVGTTTVNSFTDTGLDPGSAFTYKVKAFRADGSETEFGSEISVRTMAAGSGSYANELQRIVDKFNPIDIAKYTGAGLISAVKSGFENLLGTDMGSGAEDNSILTDFVEEELAMIKKASSPMSAAERQAAQAELKDIMDTYFGGNSFENVYIHHQLTALGEKYWQAENKYIAKALYECALKYLDDQEDSVYNVLVRLAYFESQEINDSSTDSEIITALNKSRDEYLRFFTYFSDSTSIQAISAYRMPAMKYFKYFPRLLTYEDYNQDVFNAALRLVEASCDLNPNIPGKRCRERIAAWELVPLKINVRDAVTGILLPATIQINNVSGSDEAVRKVYPDPEAIPEDKRNYDFTSTTLNVLTYKGHLYDISITVAGCDPVIINNVNYENGKKYIYMGAAVPEISTTGESYCEIDFIIDFNSIINSDGDAVPDATRILAGASLRQLESSGLKCRL